MSLYQTARQIVTVIVISLCAGGAAYEVIWEHGSRPQVLRLYLTLLGGMLATADGGVMSLLRGLQMRVTYTNPKQTVPTVTVDFGIQGTSQPQKQNIPVSSSKPQTESPPPQLQSSDTVTSSRQPSES